MQLFLATYLFVFLIDSNWQRSWAQNQSNSGWGIVAYPNRDENSQFAVNIRENAPQISPLGFNLGEKICTVISGTEFSYSEVVRTLNNQIWYKVRIDNPLESGESDCPQPLQGWLIAKQSNGTRLVDNFLPTAELQTASLPADNVDDLILQEDSTPESATQTNQAAGVTDDPNLESETLSETDIPSDIEPEPEQPDDSNTIESETLPETDIPSDIEPEPKQSDNSSSKAPYLDVRPDQRPTETIVESEEEDNRWTTFSKYLLVSLGSVLGLLVITFEQACSNDDLSAGEILTSFRNKILSPIFLIRLLVLMLASFAFISILGAISTDDDLLSTIQQLSRQGVYEPIIAGFLICIVILSFTSSSK